MASETHGTHWLDREDFDAVTVVRLRTLKILDEATTKDVFDPIYALSVMGRNHLVLNLGVVEYMTSMTLGKLIMLNRRVQAANGRLALCGLTPTVSEILEATRIISLFNVYASEAEALASFGSEVLS
jgi:anti-sigma B factor antagonist